MHKQHTIAPSDQEVVEVNHFHKWFHFCPLLNLGLAHGSDDFARIPINSSD